MLSYTVPLLLVQHSQSFITHIRPLTLDFLVIHRDLKSPNILLVDVSENAAISAKVCDFGVSLNIAHRTAGRKVDCPGSQPVLFLALVQILEL